MNSGLPSWSGEETAPRVVRGKSSKKFGGAEAPWGARILTASLFSFATSRSRPPPPHSLLHVFLPPSSEIRLPLHYLRGRMQRPDSQRWTRETTTRASSDATTFSHSLVFPLARTRPAGDIMFGSRMDPYRSHPMSRMTFWRHLSCVTSRQVDPSLSSAHRHSRSHTFVAGEELARHVRYSHGMPRLRGPGNYGSVALAD